MPFGLLGPLEVRDASGSVIEVGGRQPRVVLSMLLVADGRAVPVDSLVEAIWGDEPPASAMGTLQSYVSRLRRAIEPAGGALVFDDAGYRLVVDDRSVDINRFEDLADRGRALLDAGEVLQARDVLVEAEALWRGVPLAELADVEGMVAVAQRLEERRLVALEDRFAADLQLGRHSTIAPELAEVVALHPLRENLQHQLGLALYRSGRQAEALRALNDAATTLRDDLGIEPSRQLRDLEAAILSHDASLDLIEEPARLPAATSAAAGPALEGRAHEMGQLIAALDEAAQVARVVVTEGEPGIGKTRLAEELAAIAAARGATVAWGRGDERGAAPALWPWLSVLRPLADLVERSGRPADPRLTELLEGGRGDEAHPGVTQFEQFESIAQLVECAAGLTPLVLILDDVQWADVTSLELLGFLARGLTGRVLMVAMVRHLDFDRHDAVRDALALIARVPGSRRLVLRGLTLEAVGALVATSGATVGAGEVARIYERADGNPFYALELARLGRTEAEGEELVPATIGDVIGRRLRAVPADTRDLLDLAAVVGRDVDVAFLARAAGLDAGACAEALDPAVVARILVEADGGSGLRFSHALVREVLLEGLTALRRARMHLRVADAMEATAVGVDDIEVLADHLWRAASVGAGGRAVAALERGAEVAIARVAYPTAEALLTRSLQLRRTSAGSPEDLGAELAAIVKLFGVMRATHYFQSSDLEMVQRAEDIAHRLRRDDVALDMRWLQSVVLPPGSREMGRIARSALALTARDARPLVQAWGEQVYAVWCWGSGQLTEAVEHFDRSIALAAAVPEPESVLDAERVLITKRFAIVTHAMVGDRTTDESIAAIDDLIASALDAADVASLCTFGSVAAGLAGRWDEVDRFQAHGLAVDPASQYAFWNGLLVMARGIVEAWHGDVEHGAETFAEGRARFVDAGGTSTLAAYDAFLALVCAERGRLDVAAAAVARARHELEVHHERWTESQVHLAEAVLAHALGDPERARVSLGQAASVATEQGALGLLRRVEEIGGLLRG